MTQTERILALLRQHPEGITPLMALEEAGSFRLAARIWELKAAGYDVRTETLVLPNRGGGHKSVARYVLVEQVEQLRAFG